MVYTHDRSDEINGVHCTPCGSVVTMRLPCKHAAAPGQVGFPKRDPAKLAVALANTHCTMWIRCTRGSRWARLGQLLGFARATSDKALTATIWDVAVRGLMHHSDLAHLVSHACIAAWLRA